MRGASRNRLLHHLRALLAGARATPARAAATDTGIVLDVPAVVPGAWFGDLDTAGDHGFRDRLRNLPIDAIFRLQAPELAGDVDTPEDLREAIATGLIDAPP